MNQGSYKVVYSILLSKPFPGGGGCWNTLWTLNALFLFTKQRARLTRHYLRHLFLLCFSLLSFIRESFYQVNRGRYRLPLQPPATRSAPLSSPWVPPREMLSKSKSKLRPSVCPHLSKGGGVVPQTFYDFFFCSGEGWMMLCYFFAFYFINFPILWDAVLQKRLAWALFVLLFSTSVCC